MLEQRRRRFAVSRSGASTGGRQRLTLQRHARVTVQADGGPTRLLKTSSDRIAINADAAIAFFKRFLKTSGVRRVARNKKGAVENAARFTPRRLFGI